MRISGTQIVVGMRMVVTMDMIVRLTVMMSATKQPGAREVDREPETRDPQRWCIVNLGGRKQAADRLDADAERNQRQNESAREAREIADLTGSKGEARIIGMAPRESIRSEEHTSELQFL